MAAALHGRLPTELLLAIQGRKREIEGEEHRREALHDTVNDFHALRSFYANGGTLPRDWTDPVQMCEALRDELWVSSEIAPEYHLEEMARYDAARSWLAGEEEDRERTSNLCEDVLGPLLVAAGSAAFAHCMTELYDRRIAALTARAA